jgi:hypothetical protein
MKIKIIKCNDETRWYKNYVGVVLTVGVELETEYFINPLANVSGGNIKKYDAVKISCETCDKMDCKWCGPGLCKWQYKEKRICCNTCKNDHNGNCKIEMENLCVKYSRWEEKEIKKMKNCMKEVCSIIGMSQCKKYDIYNDRGQLDPDSPYFFDGTNIYDKNNGTVRPGMFAGLFNGTYTIKPIVEFAKPIWIDSGVYKYFNDNGEVGITEFEGYAFDYYCRTAGNMFAPDETVPKLQIDQIVADMKGNKI